MKRTWEYKKSSPVNLFGAFGYTILLMSLALTVIVYFVWLGSGGTGDMPVIFDSADQVSDQTTSTSDNTSFVDQFIAYGLTGLVVVVALFIGVTLPYWLGRWSSRLLKRAMILLDIPQRTLWLIWSKTAVVAVIGAASCVVGVYLIDGPMQDVALTAFFAMGMAFSSWILFIIQHYMAKVGRIDISVLW